MYSRTRQKRSASLKTCANLHWKRQGFLLPIKRCLLFVRSEFAQNIKHKISNPITAKKSTAWKLPFPIECDYCSLNEPFLDNFSCKLDWTILPQIETSLIKAWWERKNEARRNRFSWSWKFPLNCRMCPMFAVVGMSFLLVVSCCLQKIQRLQIMLMEIFKQFAGILNITLARDCTIVRVEESKGSRETQATCRRERCWIGMSCRCCCSCCRRAGNNRKWHFEYFHKTSKHFCHLDDVKFTCLLTIKSLRVLEMFWDPNLQTKSQNVIESCAIVAKMFNFCAQPSLTSDHDLKSELARDHFGKWQLLLISCKWSNQGHADDGECRNVVILVHTMFSDVSTSLNLNSFVSIWMECGPQNMIEFLKQCEISLSNSSLKSLLV